MPRFAIIAASVFMLKFSHLQAGKEVRREVRQLSADGDWFESA